MDYDYLSQVHGNRLHLPLRISSVDVDGQGRGFAVGEHGLVLQRTGDADHPWRRLDAGVTDDFYSLAVAPDRSGGQQALIGGEFGDILTYYGDGFHIAREADKWSPFANPYEEDNARFPASRNPGIYGVALVPGSGDGQIEAWAIQQTHGDQPSGQPTQLTGRPRLTALVLALGLTTVRPTGRRRAGVVPAPARSDYMRYA
jgi:hypothetical protein